MVAVGRSLRKRKSTGGVSKDFIPSGPSDLLGRPESSREASRDPILLPTTSADHLSRPRHSDGVSKVPTNLEPYPSGTRSIWRHIRRDVVLLGAGTMGTVFAQLCFRSILVVALIPVDYGRLSLILSIYNTVWIIGATGLPSTAARYIAIAAPFDDLAVIKAVVRAGCWPTLFASVVVAVAAGIILSSLAASLIAAIGLICLIYSALTMGILRGRGRIGSAASVMPSAGFCEVLLLVILWRSGLGVSDLSALAIFCSGNVVGLFVGVFHTVRTTPMQLDHTANSKGRGHQTVPTSRQLLGFSMWLSVATICMGGMPLVMRSAAAINSYTVVAIVDIALVLFTLPQRIGVVIVSAVVPHASRAVDRGSRVSAISFREHIFLVVPFALVAAIASFTPFVGWIFELIGRPEYGQSADYLALALLAGPARVLYGLVEGMLVAHGEGRFMALNALSIASVAAILIVVASILGSMLAAFAIFAIDFWVIYLSGLRRVRRLEEKQIKG